MSGTTKSTTPKRSSTRASSARKTTRVTKKAAPAGAKATTRAKDAPKKVAATSVASLSASKAKTTRKTATSATASKATPTPPKAPAARPVTPSVVQTATPEVTKPAMRRKDLIEAVVARTDMKKRDVKPVVEALLSVMGEAMSESRELNLPPFGKLKTKRTKDLPNARVAMVRVRQPKSN